MITTDGNERALRTDAAGVVLGLSMLPDTNPEEQKFIYETMLEMLSRIESQIQERLQTLEHVQQ